MVHGVRTLVLAAGGGGDVITGSVLARPLELTEAPVLMSYSWDRLLFDPLPGPRTAAQIVGLRELAFNVRQVLPGTVTVQPGNSSLPRLASQLQAPLILLDPVDGAIGMSRQIRATAEHFGIQRVIVVDVGGDVLTDGRDPGLRSPLADQLTFAACALTDLAVDLVIAAPGLDGELPRGVVLDRLATLGASRLTPLTPSTRRRSGMSSAGILRRRPDCSRLPLAGVEARLRSETSATRCSSTTPPRSFTWCAT